MKTTGSVEDIRAEIQRRIDTSNWARGYCADCEAPFSYRVPHDGVANWMANVAPTARLGCEGFLLNIVASVRRDYDLPAQPLKAAIADPSEQPETAFLGAVAAINPLDRHLPYSAVLNGHLIRPWPNCIATSRRSTIPIRNPHRQQSDWRARAQGGFVVPYVAILVRGEDETWRAYLPDFTGCRAEGESAEVALGRAKNRARELNNGAERSAPRSLMEIRDDPTWARDRGIDWQDAIVVMVTL